MGKLSVYSENQMAPHVFLLLRRWKSEPVTVGNSLRQSSKGGRLNSSLSMFLAPNPRHNITWLANVLHKRRAHLSVRWRFSFAQLFFNQKPISYKIDDRQFVKRFKLK